MIVIDAQNLILGRFATFAAKQALLGQDVRIINCEKAVVSGKKQTTIKEAQQARNRGIPAKGPFVPKMADRYVRRVIRGMLPYKQAKGAEAFKRVLCYKGIPEEFAGKETTSVPGAEMTKLPTLKFMTVEEVISNI